MTRRKVVFEQDLYPDFSWLRNAYDGEWYRDRSNHVALAMLVYEMAEDADDWMLTDSLSSIDFLVNGDDWTEGTFYRLRDLARFPYLHDLAKDAGLPE